MRRLPTRVAAAFPCAAEMGSRKAYHTSVRRSAKVLKISLLVLLLWLPAFPTPFAFAETVEKLPAPTSYVSDFAGVIDAASKQNMEQLCREVDRQAHAQIAVVTIHTLEGVSKEDFASKLEEKWKVGKKGTDKGVLMLFAVDERQYWIEVGYGLEGVLNDAKVGDIGRSMRPDLKAGAYGQAIYGGLRQISDDIAADAGVTLTTPAPKAARRENRSGSGSGLGTFIKIGLFVLFLFIIFGRRGGRGGFGGGGGGSWLPWFVLGNVLGGRRGGGGGGFDGGGFGGGSDGGGGGSDGGFGGFGGGSSGGGGAGGDW